MSWGVEGLRRVMLRLSCTRVERRASPRVCMILRSIWYDTDEKMICSRSLDARQLGDDDEERRQHVPPLIGRQDLPRHAPLPRPRSSRWTARPSPFRWKCRRASQVLRWDVLVRVHLDWIDLVHCEYTLYSLLSVRLMETMRTGRTYNPPDPPLLAHPFSRPSHSIHQIVLFRTQSYDLP
jgi:hypothetical protein